MHFQIQIRRVQHTVNEVLMLEPSFFCAGLSNTVLTKLECAKLTRFCLHILKTYYEK